MEKEKGVKPWDILAITFTNKAANEMKERIANLVGDEAADIWMGTYHSICVRILRRFIDRIGFDTSFIIFDTTDQRTLVKNCLKDLNIEIDCVDRVEAPIKQDDKIGELIVSIGDDVIERVDIFCGNTVD